MTLDSLLKPFREKGQSESRRLDDGSVEHNAWNGLRELTLVQTRQSEFIVCEGELVQPRAGKIVDPRAYAGLHGWLSGLDLEVIEGVEWGKVCTTR